MAALRWTALPAPGGQIGPPQERVVADLPWSDGEREGDGAHGSPAPQTLLMLAALAASVMAVVVLAIGFSSIRFASGESSKAGSQAAKEKQSPAAARDDASKVTALEVSAIHEPFYVKGSDGKAHLEYDLGLRGSEGDRS